jgi:hypothetical protein
LKKRVKKEDARIVIFDEQPVSRDSQTAVKNKIIETLNIPVDNIEISTGVTVPFDRQDWASSGYPGLRITQKETPPGHKYHKYKSADEIRFVGKVLSGSSKKDIRGEYAGWVKTKDLIYDLKLAGKKAGTMIVLNMDFNKWQMDFNWNKERRRAYEEAKRKREEAGKKVIPSRKIRREKK